MEDDESEKVGSRASGGGVEHGGVVPGERGAGEEGWFSVKEEGGGGVGFSVDFMSPSSLNTCRSIRAAR